MRKIRNFPQFTHFASIPFIREQHRQMFDSFQTKIQQIFSKYKMQHMLNRSNTNLMHLTICMLTLNLLSSRTLVKLLITQQSAQISGILRQCNLSLGQIKYFTKVNKKDNSNNVSLIYFDFQNNQALQTIKKITDFVVRLFVKHQIINPNQFKSMRLTYDNNGKYVYQQFHITLFRINGTLQEDQKFMQVWKVVQQLLTTQHLQILNIKQKLSLTCDFLDISTRNHFDGTNFYQPLTRVQLNEFKQ